MAKAMCGVCPATGVECGICLKELCEGDVQVGITVCNNCLIKTVEHNNGDNKKDGNNGNITHYHPLTRKPILMCKCGKPFVGQCRFDSIPGCRMIDPKRLALCKTLEEHRILHKDESAWIKMNTFHGPVINKD